MPEGASRNAISFPSAVGPASRSSLSEATARSDTAAGPKLRREVDGSPVADLTITDHSWNPVSHLYQAFMKDDRGAYLASITMEGQQSEHEEETGRIQLHEHPFNKDLVISEIYEQPFREMWMREGRQTFEPLIQLQTV